MASRAGCPFHACEGTREWMERERERERVGTGMGIRCPEDFWEGRGRARTGDGGAGGLPAAVGWVGTDSLSLCCRCACCPSALWLPSCLYLHLCLRLYPPPKAAARAPAETSGSRPSASVTALSHEHVIFSLARTHHFPSLPLPVPVPLPLPFSPSLRCCPATHMRPGAPAALALTMPLALAWAISAHFPPDQSVAAASSALFTCRRGLMAEEERGEGDEGPGNDQAGLVSPWSDRGMEEAPPSLSFPSLLGSLGRWERAPHSTSTSTIWTWGWSSRLYCGWSGASLLRHQEAVKRAEGGTTDPESYTMSMSGFFFP